jgi:lipopolysaccharide/colanic/teichoic acid biosynthesis glycosyltransferase
VNDRGDRSTARAAVRLGSRVARFGADSRLRRTTDLVVALAATVLLSPLLAVIALLIKIDSPGPVLYRQERVGKDGRPFRILKFRSMVAGAERLGAAVAGRHDPRITRIGALLRASKLDELPQLGNILAGHMTLIGPRAEVPRYVRHYTDEERRVLTVRPGLTGPGQLLFSRQQAAELDDVADPEAEYVQRQLHVKLALDLDYLHRRMLRTDLAILGQTVAVVAKPAVSNRSFGEGKAK